jgi:hypothetical protein
MGTSIAWTILWPWRAVIGEMLFIGLRTRVSPANRDLGKNCGIALVLVHWRIKGSPPIPPRTSRPDSRSMKDIGRSNYLVVDDYGTGGIWFVVQVTSEDQIQSTLPTVRIVPEGSKY